jgi:hypothetical protein
MSSEIRRRKAQNDSSSVDESKNEATASLVFEKSKSKSPVRRVKSFPTWFMFCTIWSVRIVSAVFNPISDCDEVFNYWEPIHNVLFRTGLQTWEYRSEHVSFLQF